MACAALTLQEIESNGLNPCFYAALYCKKHGELRLTLPEPPAQFQPCPACERTVAVRAPRGRRHAAAAAVLEITERTILPWPANFCAC